MRSSKTGVSEGDEEDRGRGGQGQGCEEGVSVLAAGEGGLRADGVGQVGSCNVRVDAREDKSGGRGGEASRLEGNQSYCKRA